MGLHARFLWRVLRLLNAAGMLVQCSCTDADVSEASNISHLSNISNATFSRFLKPQSEPANLLVGGGGVGETQQFVPRQETQQLVLGRAHGGDGRRERQGKDAVWGDEQGTSANKGGRRGLTTIQEVLGGEQGDGASVTASVAASVTDPWRWEAFDEALASTSTHLDFFKQSVSKSFYAADSQQSKNKTRPDKQGQHGKHAACPSRQHDAPSGSQAGIELPSRPVPFSFLFRVHRMLSEIQALRRMCETCGLEAIVCRM